MYATYVKLRDAKGLRDIDVSKATNIPPSTFTDWKTGKSRPKLEKLVKIARCLGVTLDEFVDECVGGDGDSEI
jgi:repressor LexA